MSEAIKKPIVAAIIYACPECIASQLRVEGKNLECSSNRCTYFYPISLLPKIAPGLILTRKGDYHEEALQRGKN